MNLDDIEVETEVVEDGVLEAKVNFPKESNSGIRVHSSFVVQRVKSQGYEILSYLSTDTLEDEEGKAKEGVWQFKIPESNQDEEIRSELIQNVKGVGKKKASDLSEKFNSLKEIEKAAKEAIEQDKSLCRIRTKETLKRLKKYIEGKK